MIWMFSELLLFFVFLVVVLEINSEDVWEKVSENRILSR